MERNPYSFLIMCTTLNAMKICVTGGAGFIGSELVRQLVNADHKVTVLDSLTYAGNLSNLQEVESKIEFEMLDINDSERLKKFFFSSKFDLIINCAAETHVDNSITNPGIFIETNYFGVYNLLEIARSNSIKFLQVSTDEVYGSTENEFFKEESPFNPSSPYSASKAAAELLIKSYITTFDLNALIVRCSNNYGPNQYPEKLIPSFVSNLLAGRKVPVYGNGLNVREWMHVSDCASAIIKAGINGKQGDVFNISSGFFRTNIEVTLKILDILGLSDSFIEYVSDRPGHDFRYAIDSTKIRENLQWEPKVDFDSGIESTVKWYVSHPEFLVYSKGMA